jgi:hypothetical protein
MKRYSLYTFICFIFIASAAAINISYSQSLQFCEDVSQSGAPISESSVFNISDRGGYFKFLVTLPYRIGTSSVSYEIYKVDDDGYETYDNTIYQDVDPSWTWFWKEVTFYRAGRFNIYVYDADKNFLVSDVVRVQFY